MADCARSPRSCGPRKPETRSRPAQQPRAGPGRRSASPRRPSEADQARPRRDLDSKGSQLLASRPSLHLDSQLSASSLHLDSRGSQLSVSSLHLDNKGVQISVSRESQHSGSRGSQRSDSMGSQHSDSRGSQLLDSSRGRDRTGRGFSRLRLAAGRAGDLGSGQGRQTLRAEGLDRAAGLRLRLQGTREPTASNSRRLRLQATRLRQVVRLHPMLAGLHRSGTKVPLLVAPRRARRLELTLRSARRLLPDSAEAAGQKRAHSHLTTRRIPRFNRLFRQTRRYLVKGGQEYRLALKAWRSSRHCRNHHLMLAKGDRGFHPDLSLEQCLAAKNLLAGPRWNRLSRVLQPLVNLLAPRRGRHLAQADQANRRICTPGPLLSETRINLLTKSTSPLPRLLLLAKNRTSDQTSGRNMAPSRVTRPPRRTTLPLQLLLQKRFQPTTRHPQQQ